MIVMTELDFLVRRMSVGIVEFYFEKSDGTIRYARGTLNRDMCPPTKGSGRKLSDHLQLYFDVDKNEYRCFNKSKFVSMK